MFDKGLVKYLVGLYAIKILLAFAIGFVGISLFLTSPFWIYTISFVYAVISFTLIQNDFSLSRTWNSLLRGIE